MNRPEDWDNPSDLEKKHVPMIDCPESVKANEPFEVTVHVGKLLKHPNEMGHHIQWIELYNGELFIARVDLTPVYSEPRVKFTVTLDSPAELRAVERCNLHGIWDYTRKVDVA
ncbi:MAG: class II SORL domain-containing protein [Candidatus Hydrothermarchaeaceae archaeon]